MCGITGAWNLGDDESVARMTARLLHRGPDDGGQWSAALPGGGWCGVGNRRLAIRDLSPAGHMPMLSSDGRMVLTYNGELYNALELRAELEAEGCAFRSTSDAEVVLVALHLWGLAALPRLDGMFALGLVDLDGRLGGGGKGPCLLLARDPFGIKPLYWHRAADSPRGAPRFAFASESKAFLELSDFAATVDPHALAAYLTFLWVPEPHTLLRGVRRVSPGHYLLVSESGLEERPYTTLELEAGDRITDPALAVRSTREALDSAVRRQMVSDVPVGAFLSAGIDSTAIVSSMTRVARGPVRTFTVTFPREARRGETTLDDPAVAQRTADHLGTRHESLVLEPDVADLLPPLLWHMDDPVADPAILSAYVVCREARSAATVLLSGVGGDEVFAGYRKYVAPRIAADYQRLPHRVRSGVVEPLLRRLPSLRGSRAMGRARLARKFARSASLRPEDAYLSNATYQDSSAIDTLVTDEVAASMLGSDPYGVHRGHFADVRGAASLHQLQYVDLKTFMPSLNLNYNDKMSMAASVEVRVPLLDRALVALAIGRMGPELKLRGGRWRPTTKWVLREAIRGRVPDEALRQPKAGFGAPHDRWLSHDLAEMVDDLLSADVVRRRGLMRPDAVRSLVARQRSGDADAAYPVWQLLTLELWMRSFLDGERPTLRFEAPRRAEVA